MFVVREFIRHSTSKGLQDYFTHMDHIVQDLNWTQAEPVLKNKVIDLIDHLPEKIQQQVQIDSECIQQMSDEIGQVALCQIMADSSKFKQQKTAIERSQWAYLHAPAAFRRAEDIRYSDGYRYGRNWSSYKIDTSLTLSNEQASIDAFATHLSQSNPLGRQVLIEHFIRRCTDQEEMTVDAYQFMIYEENTAHTYLAFNDDNALETRVRHPVTEQTILYRSSQGILEVVAEKQAHRDQVVRAFTTFMLKGSEPVKPVPLTRYRLNSLVSETTLDWDRQDNIEAVKLVSLKLKDKSSHGRFHLEVPMRCPLSLHEYCDEHFQEMNPLTSSDFVPVQAVVNIQFEQPIGAKNKRILPVKISLPNECDLRNRTEQERLIGYKYLKRWGLITELNE